MSAARNLACWGFMFGMVGLLGGCGSGGGETAVSTSGGGSGSAAAVGTVTGFGSVFVNGTRFETSNASFTVDDRPGSQSDLKIGMTVIVKGAVGNAQRSAASVRQHDAVEGLVQSVAADGLSLVVMGQQVLVDSATLIDDSIPGRNILNLVAGTDSVEVNGHVRPNGVIQATLIEKKPAGTVTPEVRGYVSSHNDTARTFRVGGLTVNYASAVIGDMPVPAGGAWNGLLVEVNGTVFHAATSTLTATQVEPDEDGLGGDIDEFEVEGYVTQVVGAGDFYIGATHVRTTASTEFRGGTIDEIVLGAKVSAQGRLANGVVTARHVKFHASVRLEGDIATINPSAKTITITGLPGVVVAVNSQTDFDGGVADVTDLLVGDHVRVRGRVNGTSSVIATRLEQRSADDDVDLQGPVQSAANPHLTILGVTVNTAGLSDPDFTGVNDSAIGRTAFFSALSAGTVVKVQGRLSGGTVTWREAEVED